MSNAAVLTVTTNQPPVGTITQPAAGTPVQRQQRHQLRWKRHRSGKRDAAGQRVHVARRFPSRHTLSSVRPADDRIDERIVHRSRPRGTRKPTCGTASSSPCGTPAASLTRASATFFRGPRTSRSRRVPRAWQLQLDAQPVSTPLTTPSVVGDHARDRRAGDADIRRHDLRVRVVVRWRRGHAQHLDTGRQRPPTPRRIASRRVGRSTASRRRTSTTSTSPGRRWRGSIRRWTSPGARARRPPGSPPTRSARAGPARSSRSSRRPTRSTRRATTACGCGSTASRSSTTGPITRRPRTAERLR